MTAHTTSRPGTEVPAVAAERSRAKVARTAQRVSDLRRENEVLQVKLVRVSRAIHGLAADLAASRRDCRRKQVEIDSLRAELASPRVA